MPGADLPPDDPAALLRLDDRPAFKLVNAAGQARVPLICDHASNAVPRRLARGTSAHAQRRIYAESLAAGATKAEALRAVVLWLIEATQRDL